MAKATKRMGKAAGMAKRVASKLSGEHGIMSTLKKEHDEVSTLLGRIEATANGHARVDERRQLFEKLAVELLTHAAAEEESFYEPLERYPETQTMVGESATEHREMEQLIREIDGIQYAADEWMTKVRALARTFSNHVDQEENVLFPIAKDLLSRGELEAMNERFLDLKLSERERLAGAPPPAGRGAPPTDSRPLAGREPGAH